MVKRFEMYVRDITSIQELRELVLKVRAIQPDAKIFIRCAGMEDVNSGDLIFLHGWNLIDRIGYKNVMLDNVDGHSAIARMWGNNIDMKVEYKNAD